LSENKRKLIEHNSEIIMMVDENAQTCLYYYRLTFVDITQ